MYLRALMHPEGVLGCFDYLHEQRYRSGTILGDFNGFALPQIEETVTQVSKFPGKRDGYQK